ncbi:unnamed protein product [Meganyctiphanes norvegica]|uniref:Interferon-related developmental regulator N-terminal domain-containing protein n=1 Tax=Meganyctiphanes norvegica TaxID=48144 RepID=A0AAV2QI62_MEGNR
MSHQEKNQCKFYKDGKCFVRKDCLHIHPTEFTVLPKPDKKLPSKEVETKDDGSKELSSDSKELSGDVSEEYEDGEELSVNEKDSEKKKDECEDEALSETEVAEKEMRAAISRVLDNKSKCSSDVHYLANTLRERVLTPFLVDNLNDIMSIIVRSIRSGREADIVSGASLSTVVIISVATFKESERVYKSIHPIITEIISDPSSSPISKFECSTALAIGCFLSCNNVSELKNVCKTLQSLYVQSLPDENGKFPTNTVDTYQCHIAAIHNHCLLMTIMSPSYVFKNANELVEIMFTLLSCSYLGIRIAAGEAIALVYEIAREHNEDYSWNKGNELSQALKELATDSQKFRAKKDLKEQRCTFREVMRSINDREISDDKIQFGPMLQRQDFSLNTWKLKCQYQALRHSLVSGINTHLTFNIGLRNLYELGPPPEKIDGKTRFNMRRNIKNQNRINNIGKARTQSHNKVRANNLNKPVSFTNAEE